jgi:hypothetical protein
VDEHDIIWWTLALLPLGLMATIGYVVAAVGTYRLVPYKRWWSVTLGAAWPAYWVAATVGLVVGLLADAIRVSYRPRRHPPRL